MFVPRLVVPDPTDPHWIRRVNGGLNPCIAGSPQYSTGSVLANCVGYCYGRWYEIMDKDPQLCINSAYLWWSYNDGYERGQEPRVGCIMCYTSAGEGHVSIVEKISDNGNAVLTSNSAYEQTTFYTQTVYRSNNWTWNSSFTFQGCIYLPAIYDPNVFLAILKKKRNL